MRKDKSQVSSAEVLKMIHAVQEMGYDVISTENLYNFDGAAGFSSAEG
jgi:Bacterial isocitrate dehydrogenase, C-terminal domain